MMTNDEIRAAGQLMIDVADGKVRPAELQARNRFESEVWAWSGVATWNWRTYDYRAKPKLREYWINRYPNGNDTCHESKGAADSSAHSGRIGEAIHVVEKPVDE